MEFTGLKKEGYEVMGAAFAVYNAMGSGFLEKIYHECLERKLTRRGIRWQTKPTITVYYRGEPLTRHYTPDLLVHKKIIVELKAAKTLAPEHEAQLFNYLKATGHRVGYLINFGSCPKLEWRRFIGERQGLKSVSD
jgi:GxxExxY protein